MKKYIYILMVVMATALSACSISYKLNGASIDYTTTKTISFEYIPIKAPLVYAPLAVNFNDELQKKFIDQTRLEQVKKNGDLQISGAITGYSLSAQSVGQDAYARETKLTIRVKIKFVNKVNKHESFDKEFSSFRTFESTQLLTDVQDGLCEEMIKELVEEIFNASVANW